MTGFMRGRSRRSRSVGPEGEHAAVAGDHEQRAADHAPAAPTIGAAVGRQAQLRLAVVARESAACPSRRRTTTDAPTASRRAQAAVQQRLRGPGDVAVGVRQARDAVRGIGAEDAARRRRRWRRCRRPCLVQTQRAALGVDAADRRLERRARRRMSPTRSAGPTRSARRSTSLVPRGEPIGTSQRSAPLSGSMPARRGPWPTTSVSLNGGEHAGLRQRQRVARALQRARAAPSARRRPARCGRRRARRRARRPPAARVATRDAERACAT